MTIVSGFGCLLPFICISALLLTEFVSEEITSNGQYPQYEWVTLIGMFVAGAFTFGLHRLLLRQEGRVVIDKDTGQEVVLRSNHYLFFIPLKWWPVVFAILGVVIEFI